MAKIVIDARESGTSTGRYIDKLIEYLHKLQPQHNFIILTKTHRVEFMKSIAPNFEVKSSPYKEFTFAEQIGLLNQIKKLKADLVFFPMVQQPVLYRGKVVTCMQDLTTIRFRNPMKNWLVFTIKREVYKLVNKRVAKKSALLITPTEFVKQDVVNYCHVDPNKITVTLESSDKITEPTERIAELDGQKFIMYVGRPAPNKNLNRLVDAFVQIKRQHPELKLALVGKNNNEYEKLKVYCQKSSTKDVVFTDFVTEGQLRWLYEHTAAYVFPSLSEGFGLPPLEAMQFGAPVVSSSATCLPEVYKDAALYFDPVDVQDMANKINQVLSDKQLAKSLSQKGLALVKTYSWERMAKQTLEVYEKALNY